MRRYVSSNVQTQRYLPEKRYFRKFDNKGPDIVGMRENLRKGLPALLFKSSDSEVPMRLGVSNTNYYHNSRCVYVTADSKVFLKTEITKDILDRDISVLSDAQLKKIVSSYER